MSNISATQLLATRPYCKELGCRNFLYFNQRISSAGDLKKAIVAMESASGSRKSPPSRGRTMPPIIMHPLKSSSQWEVAAELIMTANNLSIANQTKTHATQ
ncbi:MAG: hypothetical protein DCC43_03285 [Candidatus Brocadia sp.]|jgi:hypothetical protein|uniref:Uncharacterized protein n=1 Tax=Candidatus Brocadia fulgida TaxID=380242 RepID=A0A0M2USB6_9BACT|nr:MAG: hypothetical protein BROFUL_02351 [Candidatus Brocadia fulgida]MCC6326290.1 hypothetical protein [Candidatus Brocadia sp.]MCE7910991.1 hypothetical protein [Candidatus Brocadia sp. AMX3]OQZ01570.1 MAG: hypothetical protein B6D35_03015 [Candidatus Brocadia sp. UTAMX2]MBV6518045.1 hypothetical protein [Candidatus Brocadia fulgida]